MVELVSLVFCSSGRSQCCSVTDFNFIYVLAELVTVRPKAKSERAQPICLLDLGPIGIITSAKEEAAAFLIENATFPIRQALKSGRERRAPRREIARHQTVW